MRILVATVTLVVVATVCTTTQYDCRCPPNFDLAVATFPVGQSPAPCKCTSDCTDGRLCCPALSSKTDLCLFPVTGNGPFPGGSRCPANFNLAAATFLVGQSPSPCKRNRDCPTEELCCPALGSSSLLCLPPVSNGLPGSPDTPHVAGQCLPPLNLAVIRFSSDMPIFCEKDSDCPLGQLCCPAINPTSNVCRDPQTSVH